MLKAACFFLILSVVPACGVSANKDFGDLSRIYGTAKFDTLIERYYEGILNLDSATEFELLNRLLQQGKQHHQPIDVVAAYDLMAGYTDGKLQYWPASVSLELKAIEMAETNKLDIAGDVCINHLGAIYYHHGNYQSALEYLLRAYERMKQHGFKNITNCCVYIHELGLLYYDLGDYKTSLQYYRQALPLLNTNPDMQRHVLNNLALCFRNTGAYDSALVYFQSLVQIAAKDKDTVWLGIATGNIGSVYLRQHEFEKAKPFCETDYRYDMATKHPEGVAGALTCLGEIYVAENKPDEAIDTLKQAEKWLMPVLYWNFGRQVYLYNTLAKAYAVKKDFNRAYYYQQQANQAADSLYRRNNADNYMKIQQQIEAEKHMAALKLLDAERKSEIMKRNYSLAGIFLLCIIVVQVYYSQKLKREKEKELHKKQEELWQSEKQRTEEELLYAQSQLNAYLESILAKNNIIEQFEAELDHLRSAPGGVVQTERIETLQKLQASNILTEDDWLAFKQLFDKAHKGFFIKLKEKYPDLTQAEIRLMAFTKLNLSGKEMAAMLGISSESIKKARQRLRKKINLPEDGGLEEVVAEI